VHGKGLAALLKSHISTRKRGAESDFLRTLVHEAWIGSFRGPILYGAPSYFDCPELLDVDPPSFFKLSPSLTRLVKKANQALIRLPRLIAGLSAMEQQSQPSDGEVSDVVDLATELLACKEDEGENAALHMVQIDKSASRLVGIPCSFQFPDFYTYGSCMLYWSARITVLRICLVLIRTGVCEFNQTEDELRAVAESTFTNILMVS